MSGEASVFDQLLEVGVVLLNVVCVLGALLLLYFRLRGAGGGPVQLVYLRWFIVAAGALALLLMLALFLGIKGNDRYSGLAFYGTLPLFVPLALSGLVALLLKR